MAASVVGYSLAGRSEFSALTTPARVAKLVDARDLKSLDFGHAGSSPAPGTTFKNIASAPPPHSAPT